MEEDQKRLKIESFHNFVRMSILVNGHGGQILREKFYRRYKETTDSDWEEGSRNSKRFLQTHGARILQNVQKIQKGMLEEADVTKWDVALLAHVLQKLWSIGEFEEENKKIRDLANVRNKLHHLPEHSIPKEEFLGMWSTAEPVMISLGVSKEEIDKVRCEANLKGIEYKTAASCGAENNVRVKRLRELGDEALESDDIDKAIRSYSKALKLYGISSIDQGAIFAARSSAYVKLMEKKDKNSGDLTELFQLALEDGNAARKLRPSWWEAYFRIGKTYEAKEDWDSAIVAYDRAIGLNPKIEDVQAAREFCVLEAKKRVDDQDVDPAFIGASLYQGFERRELGPEGSLVDVQQGFLASTNPQIQALGSVFFARRQVEGKEVPRDYESASRLFSKAAVAGNPEALYNLGLLQLEGNGVPKEIGSAVSMFRRAAACPEKGVHGTNNVGVAEAQFALGRCFEDGVGVSLDFKEAAEWYGRSSNNGSGHAANSLAFLYRDGRGVEQDIDRAVECWKLAASRGIAPAMVSLAIHYLESSEIEQAQFWFSRSLEARNLFSVMNKERFENLANAAQRIQVHNQNTALVDLQEFEDFKQSLSEAESKPVLADVTSPPLINVVSLRYWACEDEIKAQESQGFARKIASSMNYFKKGMQILNQVVNSTPSRSVINKLLHNFASCFRTFEMVICFSSFDYQRIYQWAKQNLTHENHRVRLDASVCYAHYLASDPSKCMDSVIELVKQFKQEIYFRRLLVSMLGLHGNITEGIQAAVEGLDLFPNDEDLLFYKARLMRSAWNGKNKIRKEAAVQAYTDFTVKASMDHYNRPECFYSLSEIEISSSGPTSHFAQSYFRSGQEAESKLLSCFLPYRSKTKQNAKEILSTVKDFEKEETPRKSNGPVKKGNKAASTKPKPTNGAEETSTKDFHFQTQPQRVKLVADHRELLHSLRNKSQQFYDYKPAKDEASVKVQLIGLKKITFKEMELDHSYEGYVINLTIMEDCVLGHFPSVRTIVKDDNHDFQCCFFYNLNDTVKNLNKSLSFGSKISILYPVLTQPEKGEAGIRVRSFRYVLYHSSGIDEPLCRFCWEANAILKCSTCKRRYCNTDCQKQDWNLLKHKLICNA